MLLPQNGFNIKYSGYIVYFRYATVKTQYGDHHNRYHHYHHLDHHHVACRVLGHINILDVF